MQEYFHSVRLDREKCKGCVNCIKHCPMEAIRVHDGKAKIIEDKCIDCGECIRICANHAKLAHTDTLEQLQNFRYKVALVPPSLYGQFNTKLPITKILAGVLELGFDDVFEVAKAAEYITRAIKEYLVAHDVKHPMISSACPAVVRLIQISFPELVDHIIPIESPVELAARMVKKSKSAELGLPEEEIGVFFLTPCPAKVTEVKQPYTAKKSSLDGAISIKSIYGDLLKKVREARPRPELQRASAAGIGWGVSGGEKDALEMENILYVNGTHNVIAMLNEVAMGKLQEIDYIEAEACQGGCVGGPLMVENRFVAQVRLKTICEKLRQNAKSSGQEELAPLMPEVETQRIEILPRPQRKLDEDITQAILKAEKIEEIYKELPGLDCGSCGSPNCRALAEDIVLGHASEMDCVFKLRERVKQLAYEMFKLSAKMPPAMSNGKKG